MVIKDGENRMTCNVNNQSLYSVYSSSLQESIMAEARMFTPSLGISPAALHRANNSKYTGLHHCCGQCTPGSKVRPAVSAFTGYVIDWAALHVQYPSLTRCIPLDLLATNSHSR